MRRPGIGTLVLLAFLGRTDTARPAALAPSADPVTSFIAVADSLHRVGDDAGLSTFVKDNSMLVGASVAKLLDDATRAAGAGAAGEEENTALAGAIVRAHEAAGGTRVARSLVDACARWTPVQRARRAKAVTLEEESSAARKSGDVARAVELLAQARAIYEKIGDRHSVAVNWGTTGVAHWSAGDFDVVIADYEQALAARRAVEDHILEGRTLNGLGSAYQQKGDWSRAADYYHQAIDLRRKTGDLTGLGTSITYLGHVYNKTGRYADARRQYEEALPIVESLGGAQAMVELLTGVGRVSAVMGRSRESDAAYLRGAELAAQHGLAGHEMLCHRSLADNYRAQGRFTEALDEAALALDLLRTHPDPLEEAAIYQNRGITYLNMGELDAARDDLVRCTELAATLDDPSPARAAQINLGFLYRELGSFDRAFKAAEQARVLAEQAQDGRRYREAIALRASIEKSTGRPADALASWQEALAQDQNDGAVEPALVDEVSIAALLGVTGKSAEARARLRALTPRVRAARYPDLELLLLFAMGQSFERENADSAAFYYEQSLRFIEVQGARIGGAELQTGFLGAQWRYDYEEVARFYAATFARTGDAAWSDRAFRAMERAKARGLLTLVERRVSAQMSPEEDGLLDALYSLDPDAADYPDRRAELEKRYLDLRNARVEASVAPLVGRAEVAGIDAAARALDGADALLEYALGDSASWLWVVNGKGHDLVPLPPRRELDAQVRRLRDALSRVGAGDESMLAAARSLYLTLIAPAGARIEKARSVIIVPDGLLFDLPFDALLTADPVPGAAMREQPFMARRWATTCAPSATVYAALKTAAREKSYARDLLAVGNPDFSGLARNGSAPLAPLPFAEAEVEAISTRLKDSRKVVLIGAGASEARVKHVLRSEAPRVVHLATHGLIDGAEPARSSIALAPEGTEDGYLYTLEILATPTQSRLVVMSACETARGRVSRGEGVVGLSRAFLGAGAQSVVASLWTVSDESTAELMKVFYDRMFGKKHSASRALDEARLALIENDRFSHPFFWSAFVVTGTERAPW